MPIPDVLVTISVPPMVSWTRRGGFHHGSIGRLHRETPILPSRGSEFHLFPQHHHLGMQADRELVDEGLPRRWPGRPPSRLRRQGLQGCIELRDARPRANKFIVPASSTASALSNPSAPRGTRRDRAIAAAGADDVDPLLPAAFFSAATTSLPSTRFMSTVLPAAVRIDVRRGESVQIGRAQCAAVTVSTAINHDY